MMSQTKTEGLEDEQKVKDIRIGSRRREAVFENDGGLIILGNPTKVPRLYLNLEEDKLIIGGRGTYSIDTSDEYETEVEVENGSSLRAAPEFLQRRVQSFISFVYSRSFTKLN